MLKHQTENGRRALCNCTVATIVTCVDEVGERNWIGKGITVRKEGTSVWIILFIIRLENWTISAAFVLVALNIVRHPSLSPREGLHISRDTADKRQRTQCEAIQL